MKSPLKKVLIATVCVFGAMGCGKTTTVPASSQNLFSNDGTATDPSLSQNYISRCGSVGGQVVSISPSGTAITVCRFKFLASSGSKSVYYAFKISPTTSNYDRAIVTNARLYPGDTLIAQSYSLGQYDRAWGTDNSCDTDVDGYNAGRQNMHDGYPMGFSAKTDRGDFIFLGSGYNSYPNNLKTVTHGGVLYLGMNAGTSETGRSGCSNFYYQVQVLRCVDNNGATYACGY